MTFIEFLKVKKEIDVDRKKAMDYMDDYYDEYLMYLRGVKDGCAPKE